MNKWIVIAIVAFISTSVSAATWVISPNGTWLTDWPKDLKGDGWSTTQATREQCEAAGYREATAEEIIAKEVMDAAIAAEVEQYNDTQPAVFVPRVDGSLTNVVGVSQEFVDDETNESFFVDETGSPEHTQAEKVAQFEAWKAGRAAKKQAAREAKAHGSLQDRIAALEALLGVE